MNRADLSSPSYLARGAGGELARRAAAAVDRLRSCDLCPKKCGADRLAGERGAACRTGRRAVVAGFFPNLAEERPISGEKGSGTIFFSRCPLRCAFCQNPEISQGERGHEVGDGELAAIMLHLQEMGCHNIHLVTPTHVLPQILAGLDSAMRRGLRLPLVYNTSGYEEVAVLSEFLDGIVDIYLTDLKFADAAAGYRLTGAENYPEVSRAAALEMHRQVGDLVVDAQGVAERGLLVRHLVLPGRTAGTPEALGFVASRLSRDTWVSVMRYRPSHRGFDMPPLDRPLTEAEYGEAIETAGSLGLRRVDCMGPAPLT